MQSLKSRSQAKRGHNQRMSYGRIQQNNMNEIVTYIADEIQ